MSEGGVSIDQDARNFHGLVGRIVEQLDVEFVFGISRQAATASEKPVHDILARCRSATATVTRASCRSELLAVRWSLFFLCL